jgi:hypothetical protein
MSYIRGNSVPGLETDHRLYVLKFYVNSCSEHASNFDVQLFKPAGQVASV